MTKNMHTGVLVFPGSNCDRDIGEALKENYATTVEYLWHKNSFRSKDFDFIVIPGGFSYGDYLRAGAIARFSPVMRDLMKFADSGKPILGICNGFQILCESHLLPGALILNKSLTHIAKYVKIETGNSNTIFTDKIFKDLKMPVSHAEGCYFIDNYGLNELKENDLIAFRYKENINGSVDNIAGILNKSKNILGMMPHPERVLNKNRRHTADGQHIFDSIFEYIKTKYN